MKKNILIIFVIILVVIVAAVVFFAYNQKPQDLSMVLNGQIISLLNKNPDAKDYMQNHADFKIDKKEVLTTKSILAGQKGPNFREVYQGLELQDNRYILVNLINLTGDKGLIAVVDFKEKNTPKAYGLLLLKASTGQTNGQTPSPTENK